MPKNRAGIAALAIFFTAVGLGAGLTWSQSRAPASSMTFAHHGYLTNDGRPFDGKVEARFELSFDGQVEYTETETLEVVDGYYSTVIGDTTEGFFLSDSFQRAAEIELQVIIIEREREFALEPPQVIRAAPLALAVVGDAIGGDNIRDGNIRESHLVDGIVSSEKLAPGAVQQEHLGDGVVGSQQIEFDSVTTNNIHDGTIASVDIAPGGISGTNIANNAISGANIVNGSITVDDLATTRGMVLSERIYEVTSEIVIPVGTIGVGDAACDNGDILLSGSCYALASSDARLHSNRTRSSSDRQFYECGFGNSGSLAATAEVHARCLRMTEEP